MLRCLALALLVTLSACVAAPADRTPAPAPEPAPPPPPPAPAPPANWQDLPVTPGDWRYQVEQGIPTAVFGPAGGQVRLMVACIPSTRTVRFTLRPASADARTLSFMTSAGTSALVARPAPEAGAVVAETRAADRLLDRIVFSRGHFAVAAGPEPALMLPTWPEVARVVEECRG